MMRQLRCFSAFAITDITLFVTLMLPPPLRHCFHDLMLPSLMAQHVTSLSATLDMLLFRDVFRAAMLLIFAAR